jgi:hypothetical protein
MFADIAMTDADQSRHRPWAESFGHLRRRLARIDPAVIAGTGFIAGLLWALFGALVLGRGSRPVGEAVAWTWLAVELAVGVVVFAALVPGAPPGGTDQG